MVYAITVGFESSVDISIQNKNDAIVLALCFIFYLFDIRRIEFNYKTPRKSIQIQGKDAHCDRLNDNKNSENE